ncbi:MAG: phosphate ABC transporter permease PstA [Cyanobacteria bacterium J003]|uniref:phosphate ABC transporter permease PstA n=1 Tax=Thermosynechococcus sp. M3746_W2019_013 TaxID=2747806 RepID=UPI000F109585|nr:phosphate ABC transporter permease PstA [Thermosynechococcus sp. M3746_W2019_013]RMH66261.1 MAG: phosphate ABC transporter permease PstA [Cyanobacteria bacterium J003]HIK24012.1 phosphate ABC transporter permease PstA [Thermosynechococcus sp. M3746_W2019_013]
MIDILRNPLAIRASIEVRTRWEKFFIFLGFFSVFIALLTLVLLVGDLLLRGAPLLNWRFFMSPPSGDAAEAGILTAWVGSLLVILVTITVAVPLGVAAGIYLEEYAPKNWILDFIEINITNLAGVPSIIYGLLALGFFVYILKWGESILTAGCTLALLILPVIIVATREAIRAIPQGIREGAYAVGASRWQTIADHILPYSMGGILTGVIVGVSRALGETAPLVTIGALTFITFLPEAPLKGEFPYISFKWLWSPFTVLPIQMFNWVSRPQEEFQVNAAAAGIVLLVLTLGVNAAAIYLRYRFRKSIKW